MHVQHLADNQLPLREYADATGELGDANFESRSLDLDERPKEPLFGAALFFAFFPAFGEAGEEYSKTSFSRDTRYNAGT
ncbi:MAG TPA: hypothetical protein VN325_40615, partial [Steroidobacteraceae bacterium]|nr:hypothetical protein [Steroidobacteraceae bacterium]